MIEICGYVSWDITALNWNDIYNDSNFIRI